MIRPVSPFRPIRTPAQRRERLRYLQWVRYQIRRHPRWFAMAYHPPFYVQLRSADTRRLDLMELERRWRMT